MKELFNFIKARINTELPQFRTVRMFNDQLDKGNVERTEKAFRYPACFIQFVTSEVRNRSLGIQDVVMQVIFHLAYEGYKYSEARQLEDMDLTHTFDSWVHRLRGSEDNPVQFTTFQRIIVNESEDYDNINKPILTYMTMWRDLGSYRSGQEIDRWAYTLDTELVLPEQPEQPGQSVIGDSLVIPFTVS